MRELTWVVVLSVATGCASGDPLDNALPTLPPTGGPALAAAGRLSADNFEKERVVGPASQGLVGDYFMRNDKVRLVVQAPGRAIGPCPFGGNPIDFDRVDAPAGDQLGEVSLFLQLGRTVNWDMAEVVRDGAQGGPAVLRFRGHDVKNDFLNLPGLGSFAIGIADDYRADIDLKWRAAVTYILMPGETRLRIIYTFYNPGKLDAATTFGTLTDTGAGPEIFHPFLGFGELGFNDIVGTSTPTVKYAALLGHDVAYGIVPVFADKSVAGASLPVAGVDVEMYQLGELFDAFGPNGQTLEIAANGTATREVDLLLARDIGDATAQAHAIRGEPTVPFSGTVAAGAGARVTVLDPSAPAGAQLLTTLSADADGRFTGALPAGSYRFQAEGDGWRRGPSLDASIPGGDLALTIPAVANLDYTVKDRAGASIPAKIIVVGAPGAAPDRHFRDTVKDVLPYGVANWLHSRYGDSTRQNHYDHPIPLVPGHYRVVVSRGPEWSRFEQVIDLPAGGARVDAVLDHVAPTPGYVAADFHQHSHISFDAAAPPEDRVVSYLVDGADFISSSEHDVIFDYAPLIDALDARDLLSSSIGIETTTWDYGHFIGFPLTVDPLAPNGGALDWAGGELGLNLPPPQIFDGLRKQGAKVVQVNHPRSIPGDFSSFQQTFDRVGLRFDFGAHTFYGDATLMPISALVLGLPEDQSLFAPTFDAQEVYNGHHPPVMPVDGERIDQRVDTNLRDWMNFLSFGFTPTPTGVSDSHEWVSSPGALPRTLVRVPDDSQAAIAAGVADAVVATVSGQGAPRDVVVTNAPFLQFTVDGQGIGRTVSHASGPLQIHVAVTTPLWAPVDTVEIFANNTFDIPVPSGEQPGVLVPAICYTTRATPSARCAMGIGGARPLTVTSVETVPGVAASARLDITLDITDVDADMLLARQRAGAQGRDLWLVARATGETGLFPVIPTLVDPTVPLADLVDTVNLAGRGVPSLAFTNAILVDVDGNGWKGPFQP
jgi:hypothetical protein